MENEIEKLKKEQEKNIVELSYLKGYVKGLEERINRLEQSTG